MFIFVLVNKIIEMENSKTIDLIKGEFNADEANEILFSIIKDKINFNNRQIFSCEIRNTGDIERYRTRLIELKKARKIVSELIEEARNQDKILTVDAVINIKIN